MSTETRETEVRWLSLDAAGTLIEPNPPVGVLYARALSPFGIEPDPDEVGKRFAEAYASESRLVGVGEARSYWRRIVSSALGPFLRPGTLDDVFESLWETFARGSSWQLVDNRWPALIRKIRESGVGVVVSSNNDSRLRRVFREMGLMESFDRLFVSDEFGYEKPDARFFRYVRNTIGVRSERLLHCGDDPVRDRGAIDDGWSYLRFEGPATLDRLASRFGVGD